MSGGVVLGDPNEAPYSFWLVPRVTWMTDAYLRSLEAAYSIGAQEICRAYGHPTATVSVASAIGDVPPHGIPVVFGPTIDNPADLAWHTWAGGHPNCLVLADLAKVSRQDVEVGGAHEIWESIGDLPCDEWVPLDNGDEVAQETADPVEGDSYDVDPGFGDKVSLSNWVTPQWFDPTIETPKVGDGEFDRMGKCGGPRVVMPNGYALIMKPGGVITQKGDGPLPHKFSPAFRYGRRLASAHRKAFAARLAAQRSLPR